MCVYGEGGASSRMQILCELSREALSYSQNFSYSKVYYSGGLCENSITYIFLPCIIPAETCCLWGGDLEGRSLAAALSPRPGPLALGKGNREGMGRPFAAPFLAELGIFMTSTCSLLLTVRILSPFSLLGQCDLVGDT